MQRAFSGFLLAATLAFSGLWAAPAGAQSTIKQPGNHPKYGVELEPHLLAGVGSPGYAGGAGFGLGGRVSIPIVDNGFVTTINNSVAISFGLDWVRYDGYDYGYGYRYNKCARTDGNGRCILLDGSQDNVNYIWAPVTLQWNFWLSDRWSVMGEAGLAFSYARYEYYNDTHFDFASPALYVGGRWHFSESAALTLRLGTPSASLGFSFLL